MLSNKMDAHLISVNPMLSRERDLHQRLKDMAGGPLANIRVCGCISWRWKLRESEGDTVTIIGKRVELINQILQFKNLNI